MAVGTFLFPTAPVVPVRSVPADEGALPCDTACPLGYSIRKAAELLPAKTNIFVATGKKWVTTALHKPGCQVQEGMLPWSEELP